ncbi:MAG: FkbM family methyltransferase [Methylobacter sp.]|nr:FkbM family methyltransferase [Methylobacter sp.]
MELLSVCGHTFVKEFLGATPSVVDCGANYGAFSTCLAKEHLATVYGFEPDPRLFPMLPELENVTFFNSAVSGSGANLILNLGEEKCSSAYFSEEAGQTAVTVKSTKLNDFCSEKELNKIDLLKLDIEGAEIEVLEKLPPEFLATVGQITVEFHDFLDKAEVPRIQDVVRRIQEYGFYFVKLSHYDYSDCLFINTKVHAVNSAAKIDLLFKKYYIGVKRILKRRSKTDKLDSGKRR